VTDVLFLLRALRLRFVMGESFEKGVAGRVQSAFVVIRGGD